MSRLGLLLWPFVLFACSEDYEIRVVPNGTKAPAGKWEVMAYHELGSACVRNSGRILFRRPEHTTNLAVGRCYKRDERSNWILVSLDLPEESWRAQGWKRCTPEEEKSAVEDCRDAR